MATQKLGAALGLGVTVLRPPMMALTRRDWQGVENIPSSGGCVVVPNHISYFDPLVVAHFVYDAGRLPRFLVKSELFEVRFVGRLLASAGQIPVFRRSAKASEAFQAAVRAVERGECVIVYAEGTITKDPDLWPMLAKTGAARIALTTGCPVIPLAQWGSQQVLAPYRKTPRLLPRKTMHVRAGTPVRLDDVRAERLTQATLREATDRISDAVTSLLEQIRGERAPSVRFDPATASRP